MSTTLTFRPSTVVQQGSWTVVGTANAATAVSDGSDSTYVQNVPRCRQDSQMLRLSVTSITGSIPTGAQISSVGVRVRIQTVVYPAPQPQCLGWFRCQRPPNIVTAIANLILLLIFGWRCPQQPTTVWQEQDLEDLTVDPSGNPWTIASFNAFEVNLGRDDSNANPLRISEVYVDVTFTQQSTVTVTGPTATVTTTCAPTVTWSFAQPDGNGESGWQVAIYNTADTTAVGFAPFVTPPVQQSGWQTGTDLQWTLTSDITNGNYTAYVQVKQSWDGSTDFVSGIASGSWTQGIPGPPPAVISAGAFDPTYDRNVLQIAPGSGTPTTQFMAVQVSRDSGITWGPVRNALLLTATGGTQTVNDYEAPHNAPSMYRVLAYTVVSGIPFAASAYSNIVTLTPTGTGFWLKDPLDPTLNTPFPIAYKGDAATQRRVQATFEVISGDLTTDKVVVNGPMYGIEGTLTLIFTDQQAADYWAAFRRLDRTGHTLLMQYENGEQHFVKFGPGAVGSDMSWEWEIVPNYRKVTVSYTEVGAPEITS